jgi:hypothetical protein
MVLNLKTAKALGLDVPATVLTRGDRVSFGDFWSWPIATLAHDFKSATHRKRTNPNRRE